MCGTTRPMSADISPGSRKPPTSCSRLIFSFLFMLFCTVYVTACGRREQGSHGTFRHGQVWCNGLSWACHGAASVQGQGPRGSPTPRDPFRVQHRPGKLTKARLWSTSGLTSPRLLGPRMCGSGAGPSREAVKRLSHKRGWRAPTLKVTGMPADRKALERPVPLPVLADKGLPTGSR